MKPERTKEEILARAMTWDYYVPGKLYTDTDTVLKAMEEYRSQSSPVESRDAFAMKFLEYASGLAVSNYKSGGNWYLSDGRIVKTADILKQFKSELPIEETKEK